jgi:membrane associated rhomboid family serine protease
MFQRRTTGSVVCPSCGNLVGIRDERCYSCGRWNPGMWGFAPALRRLGADFGFVPFVIGASVVLYLATLVLSGSNMGMNGVNLFAPDFRMLILFGASGSLPVFGLGEWWTVLSASWLHGSALHIFFNMLWVRQLGPATADIYGAGRMIIIYVIGGACGFLLSSLFGSQLTVGASASIFALLGALVHYGRQSGSSMLRREALYYAGMLFFFGLIMRGVDNFAHAGGFVGGYLTSMVLNPIRHERVEHMIVALICLAATLLAIVASIVRGLALLRP